MFKKKDKLKTKEKVINIETGMEGNVKFSGPVNLRISGKFEGELESKGVLIISDRTLLVFQPLLKSLRFNLI